MEVALSAAMGCVWKSALGQLLRKTTLLPSSWSMVIILVIILAIIVVIIFANFLVIFLPVLLEHRLPNSRTYAGHCCRYKLNTMAGPPWIWPMRYWWYITMMVWWRPQRKHWLPEQWCTQCKYCPGIWKGKRTPGWTALNPGSRRNGVEACVLSMTLNLNAFDEGHLTYCHWGYHSWSLDTLLSQ